MLDAIGFNKLQLPVRNLSRVRLVSELIVGSTLNNFYAVLTEAHFSSNDSSVDNFDDLFLKCGLEKTESNLSDIRKKGLIYEGEKKFSSQLSRLLREDSSLIYIRSDETGKIWKRTTENFFSAENFFSLIDEDFGEFEITNDNNSWYGVLRDSDPIVFIVVSDSLSDRLAAVMLNDIMPLSSGFNCH